MHTIDQAAASLGVSPSTVRAWCDLAGLPPRRGARGRRTLTAEDMARLEAVARMRQAGQDIDLIRAALGVATDSPQHVTTVTPLIDTAGSPSPQAMLDRLAGTLEAAIGEGERWGAVLARLSALETELSATRGRLATLEVQHTQTLARVTAHEARKPRFGWVALSVAVAATAGALLGRPVPVDAAPSLAAQVSALKKDVYLLKVAANTLARRDFWIKDGSEHAMWTPFTGAGWDRRHVVSEVSNKKNILQSYADIPGKKPDPLYDSDLCDYCFGVLP